MENKFIVKFDDSKGEVENFYKEFPEKWYLKLYIFDCFEEN